MIHCAIRWQNTPYIHIDSNQKHAIMVRDFLVTVSRLAEGKMGRAALFTGSKREGSGVKTPINGEVSSHRNRDCLEFTGGKNRSTV